MDRWFLIAGRRTITHGSSIAFGLSAATVTIVNDFPVNDPHQYNPLGIEELGKSAVRKLMDYPSVELSPADSFDGVGIYTIHYQRDFPPYANMADEEPIYVGKAEPHGRRQGRAGQPRQSPILHGRLREHAASLEAVNSLKLRDFRCRWLVLDPVWIGLTEQVLIAVYRPLWNSVVDGFGNHDPGSGRQNQRRSPWDTLHKGRQWAERLKDGQLSNDQIMDDITRHRMGRKTT
ncbi:MAG: Eco29kI family restriction endonuclease [Synechococcus sp. SB0666_bin_14]|nr:Eco29kI family restriction endonuclease [Synechococcus sp. SB0666_bin_14]MYA90629.1 Eco29kI family restriction endonuclease [Synechococcus sp. SB0663_bin_10]MYG46705.1 Eco29kI family restriction endonuclease [Synechococcus sp. SB0675_bin_6]MYJ59823.1 Eco29kI family restriction endonuclease [Synechococcus sp. SB0672_bin_6]MYK91457.1 Eco29kI family restriction endonuclease [Synechococcus sp. SB0669_bin_8]